MTPWRNGSGAPRSGRDARPRARGGETIRARQAHDLLRRRARRRQDVRDARGRAGRGRGPEARRRGRHRRDARPLRHGRRLLIGSRAHARGEGSSTAASSWRSSTSTPRWRAKPQLILVDELAHTNAPGSRHPKRWQDVEELLDAGIDVFTTLNVQHLESLNDVVAQITGVVVRETVPDAVFDKAYEVRAHRPAGRRAARAAARGQGLHPAAGGARRRELLPGGQPHRAARARAPPDRRAGRREDARLQGRRTASRSRGTPASASSSCVSSEPALRAPRARARGAWRPASTPSWSAVYVETPASLRMSTADRERLPQNMRLVESLGGEAVTLRGGGRRGGDRARTRASAT